MVSSNLVKFLAAVAVIVLALFIYFYSEMLSTNKFIEKCESFVGLSLGEVLKEIKIQNLSWSEISSNGDVRLKQENVLLSDRICYLTVDEKGIYIASTNWK